MTVAVLLQSTIKMSCIILAALAASAALRKASAALRHWILAAAIASAAVAPFIEPLLPTWKLPAVAQSSDHRAPGARAPMHSTTRPPAAAPSVVSASARPGSQPTLDVVLIAVWIAGAAIGALIFVAGTWRVWRMTSRARAIGGEWARQAASAAR